MNPSSSKQYALPRTKSSSNNRRVDPFGDFMGSSIPNSGGGFDHHALLASLANERAEAAEKRELAKNAGSLLRKMDRGSSQNMSAGRESHASSRASSTRSGMSSTHLPNNNNQQPISQLKRLQMTMSSLARERNGEDADDDREEDTDYYDDLDNFDHIKLSTRPGAGGAPSSPSRTDFNKLMRTPRDESGADISMLSNNTNNNHVGKSPSSGMNNSTAQHILKDMQGLRDSIGRLENHLMADMKRRVESHAALQRTVELRVREISENAERRGQDRMVKLHHTLDSLTQRVSKLEDALSIEREKNARLVQELKYHAARGLQDVRQQLEVERNARSERVAAASRNFSQDLFRVEEHIAVAKRAREGLGEEVRDAITRAQDLRVENEDKMLQSIMNDVRILKNKLEGECREREAGEEQLAGAMADLAQHLQDL